MKERGMWEIMYIHTDGTFCNLRTCCEYTPNEVYGIVKNMLRVCLDICNAIAVCDKLDVLFEVERLEVCRG